MKLHKINVTSSMGKTTILIFNRQQWALCELMSLRNNPSQTENSRAPKNLNVQLREGQQGQAKVQADCCMKGNFVDWDSSAWKKLLRCP